MKIVMIGRNDPAGMMITFANAINRYTEHTARVISLETRYAMSYEYDLQVPDLGEDDFDEVRHLLEDADVIHFHMLIDEHTMIGPVCIRDHVEGKKFLQHHHGHPDLLINADTYTEKYRKLGRQAIVSTPDLVQLMPDATWQPNMVPLYEADFLPREDHLGKQDRVRIVQAPTRKWHKHTAVFNEVAEEITARHANVEIQILEGYSYRECLKVKRSSHIVFDHMNGWFGISSLESLAHGVPVLAGLDEWNIDAIRNFTGAEVHPWVVVRNREDLQEALERLVTSPEERVSIGKQSRAFMEKYWSEQSALRVLMDTYARL